MIDLKQKDTVNKTDLELVQKQKHEYKLLDSFSRRKGTKLFSYNPADFSLCEVTINYSETIHSILTKQGWVTVDFECQKAVVDSRYIYFESISLDKAKLRVNKYKNNLSKLCNMKPVKNGKITLF